MDILEQIKNLNFMLKQASYYDDDLSEMFKKGKPIQLHTYVEQHKHLLGKHRPADLDKEVAVIADALERYLSNEKAEHPRELTPAEVAFASDMLEEKYQDGTPKDIKAIRGDIQELAKLILKRRLFMRHTLVPALDQALGNLARFYPKEGRFLNEYRTMALRILNENPQFYMYYTKYVNPEDAQMRRTFMAMELGGLMTGIAGYREARRRLAEKYGPDVEETFKDPMGFVQEGNTTKLRLTENQLLGGMILASPDIDDEKKKQVYDELNSYYDSMLGINYGLFGNPPKGKPVEIKQADLGSMWPYAVLLGSPLVAGLSIYGAHMLSKGGPEKTKKNLFENPANLEDVYLSYVKNPSLAKDMDYAVDYFLKARDHFFTGKADEWYGIKSPNFEDVTNPDHMDQADPLTIMLMNPHKTFDQVLDTYSAIKRAKDKSVRHMDRAQLYQKAVEDAADFLRAAAKAASRGDAKAKALVKQFREMAEDWINRPTNVMAVMVPDIAYKLEFVSRVMDEFEVRTKAQS